MVRDGEARAIGDALLSALYRAEGGDGERNVHLNARRAAQICTGDIHPSRADVKYVRELLQKLRRLSFATYAVQDNEHLEGVFTITPRKRAPTRLPTKRQETKT